METREYKLNFGIVKVTIDGDTCTATYQNNGKFSGTIKDNEVKAKWTNEGIEGLIELDLSDNKLVGKYKRGLEEGPMRGKWEGTLVKDDSTAQTDNSTNDNSSKTNGGILLQIELDSSNFSDEPWTDEESGEYVYHKFVNHLNGFLQRLNSSEIIIQQKEYLIKLADNLISFPNECTEKYWNDNYDSIWLAEIFAIINPEVSQEQIDNYWRVLSAELETCFYTNYPIAKGQVIVQCYDNGDHDSGYFLDPQFRNDYIVENDEEDESQSYFKVASLLNCVI